MKIYRIFSILVIAVLLSACATSSQGQAQVQAQVNAATAEYYVPVNGVERRNYNWRQEIADDPSLILWCTNSFSNPNSPIWTTPIIGKLTSGSKRPWAVQYYSTSGYAYESPGADGMYGSSGDYRYGFGPQGKYEYYDYYSIETFCTTMPTVWQREKTVIIYEKDPLLLDATNRAHEALERGDSGLAEQILIEAINQIGNK